MAGLSEACSHVGAVMYAIETGARMRDSKTCTEEKSKWLIPSYMKDIPYLPACKMDFTSAKRKHTLLEENDVVPNASLAEALDLKRNVALPSAEEKAAFLDNISSSNSKPVILSLIKPFSERFVPKTNSSLPKPLKEIVYNPDYEKLSLAELQAKSSEVVITLTLEECQAIEKATRQQANSKLWFQQRAGRITASRMKSACHTDPEKPSKSLVKTLCYPEEHKFSNSATRWGIANKLTKCS